MYTNDSQGDKKRVSHPLELELRQLWATIWKLRWNLGLLVQWSWAISPVPRLVDILWDCFLYIYFRFGISVTFASWEEVILFYRAWTHYRNLHVHIINSSPGTYSWWLAHSELSPKPRWHPEGHRIPPADTNHSSIRGSVQTGVPKNTNEGAVQTLRRHRHHRCQGRDWPLDHRREVKSWIVRSLCM